MYIQITTRCNMSCKHCAMRCGKEGEDMSLKTFKAAIKIADQISIGGGEPTLHKNFWQMLTSAIANCEYVWLATNGSKTETALTLAKMAEKGVIGCALSVDPWHDPIHENVYKAFSYDKKYHPYVKNDDQREIRNVQMRYDDMAPWRNPEDGGDESNCVCEDLFVKPNGDVHVCGCFDSPKLGNVLTGFETPEDYEFCTCWKKQVK